MTSSFALPGPAGDACVRGEWLAAASFGGYLELEGRVHGGQPSGAVFTDSSMPLLLSSKEAPSSLLGDIEAYLNPISGELLADPTLRLTRYLAAAKVMLMLPRQQAPAGSGTASGDMHDDRPKKLLNQAMASLAMEFCRLRIWRHDADVLRGHRLGISPASIWESVRSGCRGSSRSGSVASWPSSSSASFDGSGTGGTGSSSGFLLALCEDMSVRSDKAFGRMDLIDRKVLSTLNDIAGVMIQGGYEEMLRRAIDKHSAQLASYLEILDIDNILGGHKEESKGTVLNVWTAGMHIIVGVLGEMQRQMNGQDLGYFNILKEDYFLAIAKQSVRRLLRAADICTQIHGAPVDPAHMTDTDTYTAVKPDLSKTVGLVMMYQALNCGMPTILALLSGHAEGEALIQRLSDMFVRLCVEQNALVMARRLDISDTGVHPFTRHVMAHARTLVQHGSTVCLMLKGGPRAFHELVAQLVSSLECTLDRNSRGLQLPGQRQMFLLNNAHLVLQEARTERDLGRILGEGWLARRHDQLDVFVTGYVDTSWAPVVSCALRRRRARARETLWPASSQSHQQSLDKLTSLLETTCRVHRAWKVSDPLVRDKVREAVFRKVVPVYRMHLQNCHSEKQQQQQKFARHSVEQLESQLLELFEG